MSKTDLKSVLLTAVLACSSVSFKAQAFNEFRNSRANLTSSYYVETAQGREEMKLLMDKEFQREHLGLEIMMAVGSERSTEGRFGHIFLRFLDADQDPYNDTVVGFYAAAPVGQAPSLLDFFGKGTDRLILPTVEVLNQTLLKYQTEDQRDLVRYIIPTFPLQLQKLKQVLRSVIIAPDLLGHYDLLQNNCFSALKKVMGEVGLTFFPALFMDHMFQIDRYMSQSLITPYPSSDFMLIKGIDGILKNLFSQTEKVRFARPELWRGAHEASKDERTREERLMQMPEFWENVQQLDDQAVGQLTHYWPYRWKQYRPQLIEIYKSRRLQSKSFKDFTQLTILDQRLYRACEATDTACREERWQAATRYWPAEMLREKRQHGMELLRYERQRTAQLANGEPKRMYEQFFKSLNVADFLGFVPAETR